MARLRAIPDCRDGALCRYHRHQVGAALAGLQTAEMLGRADCDLRYMLASRRWDERRQRKA